MNVYDIKNRKYKNIEFLDDNTYVFIWVRHLLSSCCEVFRLLGVILAGIVCVSKSVCVDRVSGKQSVV